MASFQDTIRNRFQQQSGGMAYDQNRASADQWNSFSNANKQRAAVMIEAQKQGVPMSQIKEMIDRNMAMSNQGSQFPKSMTQTWQQMHPGQNPSFDWGQDQMRRLNVVAKEDKVADNSYIGMQNNPLYTNMGGGIFGLKTEVGDGTKPPPKENWYDDLWKGAKNLGLKGWGELGLGALKAYQGWQAADLAEDQHKLAQETFGFEKAAWNKDYAGRKLAYNTNAENVNAWKKAQGRTDFNKLMV